MDHLKRFFLELASLGREEEYDLDLPAGGIFVSRGQASDLAEDEAVAALQELWDKAVSPKLPGQKELPSAPAVSSAPSVAAVAQEENLPLFGAFSHRRQQYLTAAELSRFFERDARRYGKGE